MNNNTLRVLMVEDSEDDATLLLHALRAGAYDVVHTVVNTAAEMRNALETQEWDVITSDHHMPGFSADKALALAMEFRPDLPFIIVSGAIDINLAVSLMKEGAKDYVPKQDLPRVLPAIERELREATMRTERKQAEESLQARDAYLTAIIENQPGLIWLKDVKGRFLATNHAFAVSCGREVQDVLGKTDLDIWPREMAEKYIADDGKVMQAGRPIVVEEMIYDNNGPKWFETFKTPIRDPHGNIIGSTGYARDITERKRVEESLRESEQELRTIFEGALDGIMVADAETGKLFIANAAICSMLGYTREEIVRMGVSDLHPKQDLPRAIEPFERMLRGEIQLAADIPMMRKDGSVFYADIKAAPIRVAGKDCLLGTFRDITERIHAERELIESEARFRGLVEQSITGIYIIQDGRLAYVNPRFAEIRGYSSADEVIGRDPLQLIAENDRGTVAENSRRLLAGEMPSLDYSFTALRKDGSSIDVGVHSALATYRGRPAIIGLLQDISEKKRAEEQINHYIAQLENAFMQPVKVATTLSEMRDPYTAGHERRVAEIAVAIGAELGFDARRREGLRVAGYLHDIGKITVPSEILSKPGKLSAIEFQLIQGHARASFDVLKDVEFPWPVAQIALQHHERMNGGGYPQGLKGEAILLDARIMAVADVVEAMSSHRPYRPGLGIDKALAEIERGRGTAYDPVVVDACLKLFREKGYAIPA